MQEGLGRMNNQVVFWTHDTYPYCKWGILAKRGEAAFTVNGYEGMTFKSHAIIAVLPEKEAEGFILSLSALTHLRHRVIDDFAAQSNQIIEQLRIGQ